MMKTNREGGDGEAGAKGMRGRFGRRGGEGTPNSGNLYPAFSPPGSLPFEPNDLSGSSSGSSSGVRLDGGPELLPPGGVSGGLNGVGSGAVNSNGSNPQEITDSAFGGPQPFDLAGGQGRFAGVLGLSGAGGMEGVPAQQGGPVGLAGVNRGGFGFNRGGGGGGGMRAME